MKETTANCPILEIMKEINPAISNFSTHLFWDVNRDQLDIQLNRDYIIKMVLEYGLLSDWLLIMDYYGLDQITDSSKTFRELEPKALAFIASLSNLPKENFRCYTTKRLTAPHWNF